MPKPIFPAILLILLLTTACLAAPAAEPTEQSPDAQATIVASVAATITAQNNNAAPTAPEAQPPATPRPTATPQPTVTPRPTATTQPTPTRRPTATPRPTRRPTATPRPTPQPVQGTKQIYAEAGSTGYATVRIPRDGYLNYSFTSTEDSDAAAPITIDFQLNDQQHNWFQAYRQKSFQAGTWVQGNQTYTFLFDNTGSWFAGKNISLRYRWSPAPLSGYPVTPAWGEHQDTARCQEARRNQGDDRTLSRVLSLVWAAVSGDWLTGIGAAAGLLASSGDSAQINAIGKYGCGID